MSAERARARLACLLRVRSRAFAFVSVEEARADGIVTARLVFDIAGERAGAFLTRPDRAGPCPAVLYAHAHGNRPDIGARELVDGRPALLSPLGPVLARMGFVTLALDMPCFGSRAGITESAAAKARAWEGGTLVGDMIGDLRGALGWLAARPEVDPARIGAYGVSMGATLAAWTAAVDPRIAAVAQLLAFADLGALVRSGAHDLHGPWLTVPGLLRKTSAGRIAGAVAPRPQFVATGGRDPLTPDAAYGPAEAELRAAYAGAPGALALLRDPEAGHAETAAMREATLAFLARTLAP